MSQSKDKLDTSKAAMLSNNELVDSLVSDLKECVVREEDTENTSNNPSPPANSSILNEPVSENIHTDLTQEEDINYEPEDDLIDELALKDRELTYSDEDRQRLHEEAESLKQNGNTLFKSGEFRKAAFAYTQALRICPLAYSKERAILYSNRAAAKMKLERYESAIEDCTKSLELDGQYLKALYRRAQLYESSDKLDEALADYHKILEIDPLHKEALNSSKRLPDQINDRNERLKTEMMGKMKDLGNMILKPFGLSTNNFQMTQDPNSGGYSISFKN